MTGRDRIVNPMQASVHRKLDEISHSLDDPSSGFGTSPGQRNTAALVSALRTVLTEHHLDPSGHCTRCHGRRPGFLARRRRGQVPCRAYLAVQLALGPAIEDTEVASATSRHRARKKADLGFAS